MTEHRPPGRRRFLSDEEIDLWLQVTRDVELLPGRTRPPRRAARPPTPPETTTPLHPPGPVRSTPRPTVTPPLALLDRRLRQRIARGRIEIEAAIDLHGLDQGEAHRALLDFIGRAHAGGRKLVLVVTGKGRGMFPDDAGLWRESGVLRRLAPLWLRAPELRRMVMGFEEAAPAHGGAGALYVRLRRRDRGQQG